MKHSVQYSRRGLPLGIFQKVPLLREWLRFLVRILERDGHAEHNQDQDGENLDDRHNEKER